MITVRCGAVSAGTRWTSPAAAIASGRSKKLCTTLANLALDVETMLVTWPLEGYGGVRNRVGFDEFRAACAQP
jgi:hypothetical protein